MKDGIVVIYPRIVPLNNFPVHFRGTGELPEHKLGNDIGMVEMLV
jgi:hypothetical protein